jgi:hypothetical protein
LGSSQLTYTLTLAPFLPLFPSSVAT